MIVSMTGFARREASGPWGTLICELRSVNHRFLETGFRLPEEIRSLEPDLRQALMRELKRGKVDCTLIYRATLGGARAIDVDSETLQRLLLRLRDIAAAMPQGSSPGTALDVLRWPGVIRESGSATEELLAAARELFGATLHELAAARAREVSRLTELVEPR
jgi:uncharacterized protein (TIGR00255 family)